MPKWNQVTKHNTSVSLHGGVRVVKLHKTEVVRHDTFSNVVKLNSGGWETVTTKSRMNQYSHQYANHGYGVFQKDGVWYVRIHSGPQAGETVDFYDGMEIQL